MSDLDPNLTFDNLVVGSANRLAVAAARRAAESPGTAYNLLFLYSPSGLGKSHILNAVAHHARKLHPESKVVYRTLEGFLGEIAGAVGAGGRERLLAGYREVDVLLLDDVQFLTGRAQAQEVLLEILEAVSGKGRQAVLASDRPPADIGGLDARLLSRFSVGLVVDIAVPEYETRMAIVRKKLEDRGAELQTAVLGVIARFPSQSVRELQGGLNRILAIQDLEDREVDPEEASRVLGASARGPEGRPDDAHDFLLELSEDVAASVDAREAPWKTRIRREAREAETRGFSTDPLVRLLEAHEEPPGAQDVVARFRAALDRLEEIRSELDEMGNPWPEAASAVLRDPERLEDAEALLVSARERVRPFPTIGEGPDLESLSPTYPSLVVKAARRLVVAERPEYNPLFLTCPVTGRTRRVMAATGRSFRGKNPEGQVALASATEFAEGFARARSLGVVSAWRERWWATELLMVYGIEALSDDEPLQDEFFHLFEALKRRQARIFLAAAQPPSSMERIHERLRSRFEGGLAVEMSRAAEGVEAEEAAQEPRAPVEPVRPPERRPEPSSPGPTQRPEVVSDMPGGTSVADLVPASVPTPAGQASGIRQGPWKPSPEKVVWRWPRLEERLIEGPP